MTNGSKALIYLTLIYFLLHFCLVKEPPWSIINHLLMHFLFFQVHQQSQNNVNSTTLIAIISKSSIPDQSLTIFWSKITRVLMVLPYAIYRCSEHSGPKLEIPFGKTKISFFNLMQARLWACGRGDMSTPSFGSHHNPISTRGDGGQIMQTLYWCPHQVLKATGAPETRQ